MDKSKMLVEYSKTHGKKEIAWYAQKLFGVDANFPVEDGGPGSGNYGHAGRPGQRGGSAPGKGGGGGSYTQGQSVKSLGTITRLEARRHSDSESRRQANIALEKATRPKESRIGSVKKVTTALPVGTIVNHSGTDYVKQHNGDWIGKNGVIKRKDAPTLLEQGGRITSVPKVTSFNKALHNGKIRDAEGFQKGEFTEDVKAYTSGHGVTSEKFPKGMGVTRIEGSDLVNRDGKHTAHTLADNIMEVNGSLVLRPEREALHQQIIEDAFEGKEKRPEGQKPHITILGGGAASGKGSFTKEGNPFGIPDSGKQLTIDPDEVKAQLPEYALERNKKKAAMYAHEESSVLGKRMMEAAIANGYDYTLDGTGDNSAKTMLGKINAARAIEDGTVVSGAYMTCPTDLAVKRSIERGEKTERYVPPEVVASIHSKVSHVFPQIASEFDHVELYDSTGGGDAKLIASCKRGEKIKVHDEEAYKAFLAKDKEKFDPNKDIFDPKANPYGVGKEPSSGEPEKSGRSAETGTSERVPKPEKPTRLTDQRFKKVSKELDKVMESVMGEKLYEQRSDEIEDLSHAYFKGEKKATLSSMANAVCNRLRELGYSADTTSKRGEIVVDDPESGWRTWYFNIGKSGTEKGAYYMSKGQTF